MGGCVYNITFKCTQFTNIYYIYHLPSMKMLRCVEFVWWINIGYIHFFYLRGYSHNKYF